MDEGLPPVVPSSVAGSVTRSDAGSVTRSSRSGSATLLAERLVHSVRLTVPAVPLGIHIVENYSEDGSSDLSQLFHTVCDRSLLRDVGPSDQ